MLFAVDLQALTWQTDNGSEFMGELQPDGSRSHFPAALTYFGSQHVRIPPAAQIYQSDVETIHRLMEDEFFDLESFSSRADFLAKASLYQLYFNLARRNSHKRGLTPWQIIHQLAPHLPLHLCLLPPVLLDYRLDSQGGYDLPSVPSRLIVDNRGTHQWWSPLSIVSWDRTLDIPTFAAATNCNRGSPRRRITWPRPADWLDPQELRERVRPILRLHRPEPEERRRGRERPQPAPHKKRTRGAKP